MSLPSRAEITPPLSADPEALFDKVQPLAGLADAVNAADGASARPHLDTLTAAGLMLREAIEPVLQVTCRDRNRIALQSLLIGAAAQGIRNVLALTGDDPKAGDQPDAKPVFDLKSNALLLTARIMREQHELPTGRASGGQLDSFLAVRTCPSSRRRIGNPPPLPRRLRRARSLRRPSSAWIQH